MKAAGMVKVPAKKAKAPGMVKAAGMVKVQAKKAAAKTSAKASSSGEVWRSRQQLEAIIERQAADLIELKRFVDYQQSLLQEHQEHIETQFRRMEQIVRLADAAAGASGAHRGP